MYYIIYKITNLINHKIYIGAHETENLEDGYMGSGKHIKASIKKHGKKNFKKEILFQLNTRKEMYLKESEIINEEFVKRNDTYNIILGGEGGLQFIKGTDDWDNWHKRQIESNPACKPKESIKYIAWDKANIESKPQNLSPDDPKRIEWYIKQQASTPSNINHPNHEEWKKIQYDAMPSNPNHPNHEEWKIKSNNKNVLLMPKNSIEYINAQKKMRDSNPSMLPDDDPRKIEWRKKNLEGSAKKIRGTIWIINIKTNLLKRIKPEELEKYIFTNEWIKGRTIKHK